MVISPFSIKDNLMITGFVLDKSDIVGNTWFMWDHYEPRLKCRKTSPFFQMRTSRGIRPGRLWVAQL